MVSGAFNIDPPVVVAGLRTAVGKFGGSLSGIEAHKLAAACITGALERAAVAPEEVDEVVLGQVGQVGADAYNARRAALEAGLSRESTAMNVNRLCGSGLQAVVTAGRTLALDEARVVVAGGNESMSGQPFLDYGARNGWRMGARQVLDGTLSLVTDPFGRYPMGTTAEAVAERYGVSRDDQDAFALRSQQRAAAAIESQVFADEIVPIELADGSVFAQDEHPRAGATAESLAKLKPAFKEGGSVTAGNSSGINDGAAALVLMRESEAARRGVTPKLRLRSWAVTGIDPEVMGYAPATAIPVAIEKAGLTLDDIDLVELNEAFAAQAVAVARDAHLDDERVNVHGGAIAFGHPVGATGAILTVKLMNELERRDARYGLITMCIGGGQGIAAIFERPAAID
jgi:acetyl-CoA C-acetyltransferase